MAGAVFDRTEPRSQVPTAVSDRAATHVATLDRVIAMTRSADSKAAPILALQVTLAAASVAQTGQLKSLLDPREAGAALFVVGIALAAVYLGASVVSLALAIQVFVPKTPLAGRSVAYFEDITRMSRAEFIALADSMSEAEIIDDLLAQVHAVSGIASQKFARVRLALYATAVALGAWLPGMVLARI